MRTKITLYLDIFDTVKSSSNRRFFFFSQGICLFEDKTFFHFVQLHQHFVANLNLDALTQLNNFEVILFQLPVFSTLSFCYFSCSFTTFLTVLHIAKRISLVFQISLFLSFKFRI